MKNTDSLENLFTNKDLLDQALTHRSWVNEHKGERGTNERMEFLGDAILEFVISKEIYSLYPDKEEGYLTALRANLVNTVALAEIAIILDLGPKLFLSKGEEDGGGRTNSSLLADTVEAIIGALFMDGGLEKAEEFIKNNILIHTEDKASKPLKDFKSRLQETVQAKGFSAPKYQVVEESGPDHSKKFIIEVLINGKSWGRGEGKSKSSAEQEAARQVLAKKVQ
ncbi:MAG: Ribonuclease 3 [Microgenomates group bacterium GW2011_GWC1_41_20]|uniref:Ribonuclease 3 n=7 Tax=Candidatus Woeseibacteriota TaxID=1752722 RepID=A0A0G0RTX4_9BACT|nr:MAG: Ribonuclease 3 [Candidatus Woesebacteria bacterium GW2011_GWB1_40_12]KKR56099.1 MAG: Ribonuclease 3 [Candidatus Woesebacteria bacterium GW2011_GWF1_40_24]KKR90398.1 MAG: Ribonuclease 3 [Candidatus Woesebacteria bacterium GW2011_GWD1_41_12]KKS00466.1 MAG: Ribonuclease 3 [Microgenomates group bacterium GW2011_GWC1_41_20]KKS04280.1 MAG: Ribonuclease 3 [Candidatus Woesebacteria bacterium GW2011_GWE1_41_24]KKS16610.1 MAG: Ribonuclease 3 [Candidatus Woesebacteria bacterium GW2011_GWA1_41_7]